MGRSAAAKPAAAPEPFEPEPDPVDTPEEPNEVHSFRKRKVLAKWDGERWVECGFIREPASHFEYLTRNAKPGDELWWYSDVHYPKGGGRGGGSTGYALMRNGLCVAQDPMVLYD